MAPKNEGVAFSVNKYILVVLFHLCPKHLLIYEFVFAPWCEKRDEKGV